MPEMNSLGGQRQSQREESSVINSLINKISFLQSVARREQK
jgi:hypothetical protein